MRIERADSHKMKGWFLGPWNSKLDFAVGYANRGIDEPHVHHQITEIYLIARGEAQIQIEEQTITVQEGDMLLVEPDEAHTFLTTSHDYYHLVIQLIQQRNESLSIRADWDYKPFCRDRPVDISIFACTMDLTNAELIEEYLDLPDKVANL